MERKRARRFAVSATLLSLFALLLIVALSTQRRDGEGAPRLIRIDPEQREENLAAREPVDIQELESAVNRAARLVESEDWEAAEVAAQDIRQKWVSFKPPMRANAGEKMWSTSDIDDFQVALAALQSHVQAREKAQAEASLNTLLKIIDNYNDNREGPSNRPRGNNPRETPSTPTP